MTRDRATCGALVVAAQLLTLTLAAEPSNYQLCRDQHPGCKQELLSPREAEMVAGVISGRNFAACSTGEAACDTAKLTVEQNATLQRISEDLRAARLESERNFSACANRQEQCNPAALTPEQIGTLDLLVKHSGSSPATWLRVSPDQSAVGDRVARAEATPPDTAQSPVPDISKERWKRFGKGLLQFIGGVADAYVEIETQRMQAPDQPLIIASGGGTVVKSGGETVVAGSFPMTSRISGAFEGWTGDTIFQLANGQVWQQSSPGYRYHYAYSPRVTIYRTGTSYQMKVAGFDALVDVVRVR